MCIFAASCSDALSGSRINRESGENPEQTRCCEPSKQDCPLPQVPLPVRAGRRTDRGKSEDLQDDIINKTAGTQ